MVAVMGLKKSSSPPSVAFQYGGIEPTRPLSSAHGACAQPGSEPLLPVS
jgi:hypothetical protein